MSRQSVPRSNVVDLRRWREERDRRLAAAAVRERRAAAGPDRVSGLYRVLALAAGLGFVSFGVFLGFLFLMTVREQTVTFSRIVIALLLLGPGAGIALFGIDLTVRGLLGREWVLPLRSRVRHVIDLLRRRRIA